MLAVCAVVPVSYGSVYTNSMATYCDFVFVVICHLLMYKLCHPVEYELVNMGADVFDFLHILDRMSLHS